MATDAKMESNVTQTAIIPISSQGDNPLWELSWNRLEADGYNKTHYMLMYGQTINDKADVQVSFKHILTRRYVSVIIPGESVS